MASSLLDPATAQAAAMGQYQHANQVCMQYARAYTASSSAAPLAKAAGNGVFLLLLLNVVLFVLDHVLHIKGIQGLYLNHARPQWWQWITHAFCHANFSHLSMNLFNLCVFGKMVEETEGSLGLVLIYLLTAAGAAAAAVLLQPAVVRGAVTVSLGASGAIFGLFAVSVLTRLSWDPRKLLEGLILGNFVVRQVLQEAQAQAAGGLSIGGLQVGHIAHLGGALAGVLLVWLLSKLPDPDAK
ncbi:rhomboid-like protease [Scenedesmus sp. NREL 46B-D3]|nr:rhomboid-like protease [Scenedesmus sp. NREL 46B-D3]